MPTLDENLRAIAEKFCYEIVTAIRQSSLREILGEAAMPKVGGATASKSAAPRSAKPSSGRRGRAPSLSGDQILALLKRNKGGMRSEDLRKALGTTKGPMRYHVLKLIAEKRVRMTGTRNTAVYYAS